jgi:hypothetical protein
MATMIRIRHNTAISVYDDRLRPIYDALGTKEIIRASTVEYEPSEESWVARNPETGSIIAMGQDRADVIRMEVLALESRIKAGRI